MRSKHEGIAATHSRHAELGSTLARGVRTMCRASAAADYKKNRMNGEERDARGVLALDGNISWSKGEVKSDGFVYGVKESDGYYHYECRYDEGPGDKLWMEECDWNYIQRIYREGRLLELEPNADSEIAADHKYRTEIAQAMYVARRCAGVIKAYVVAGEGYTAAKKTAEEKVHEADGVLEDARKSGFFWRDKKVKKAEEALEEVKRTWEEKIKIAEEAVTRAKAVWDQAEQEVRGEAKKRETNEAKVREAKEAQTKTRDLVSETAVVIETLRKQIITAGKDLVEIQPYAGTMRTTEVIETIKSAIAAEAEIRRQLDIALNGHEKTKAQAAIANDTVRRAEELLGHNPLDAEIEKLFYIAMKATEEAGKLQAIVLAANAEVDRQYAVIVEVKKKIALTQVERANKSAKEAQGYATNASQLLKAIREEKDKAGAVVDGVKRFSSTNKELVSAANAVMAGIEKQLELAVSSTAELTKQVANAADAAEKAKKAAAQISSDPTTIAETTREADMASQAALEAKKQLELSTITINAALGNAKKGVNTVLEVEERTKKEAKVQEDRVSQTITETKSQAESAIVLMRTLKEQVDIVASIVTEIETLGEIYTAAAVSTKKQADIDLTVKLKLQIKAAAPMVDEVKKQVAEALPLEEEIKRQVKLANDILQKAEEIRQANPIAVDEIATQIDLAAKTLTETQRLKETAGKALEKVKAKVASAQKVKERAQEEVQSSTKVPVRETEESGKKELEDLRKQAEQLEIERAKFEADKKREAEKKKLQEEIEKQKKALAEEKAVAEKVEKPEFTPGLQVIPHRTLTYGKILGQGGFGRVFQGEWQHGEVAIKELLASSLSDVAMTEFRKETEIWGKLRHPNIVQLFGISVGEPQHYSMVMELMPKGSLYQVLRNGQPLDWSIRFHIAKDIAAGLTHLHEQEILHCDLKSMNVLLDGTMRAKLTDFGLSKVRIETKTTTGGESKASGTIRWMAPELLKRGGKPSKESDVYAFGMILWEMITRKIPYEDAADDTVAMGWIKDGEKEAIPEMPEEHPETCLKAYPSYARLIARCWEERSRRPTIQESAEVLRPLEAIPEPLASGPVHLDNFVSVAPK